MSTWTLAAIAALAAVIVIGTAIKLYTFSRVKEYEGIFNPTGVQGGDGKSAAVKNTAVKNTAGRKGAERRSAGKEDKSD
jgi:hypothetical protein